MRQRGIAPAIVAGLDTGRPGLRDPSRLARASHMRIAMINTDQLPSISLDNLDSVTGGYHDLPEPDAQLPRCNVGCQFGKYIRQLQSQLPTRDQR